MNELRYYVYDLSSPSDPTILMTEQEMLDHVKDLLDDGSDVDSILVIRGQEIKVKRFAVIDRD